VGDVYIPKKVDKQGHRFGFVKYREVSDATELLRSISDIWIGSFKLRVNRSKFSKNEQPPAKEPQAMVQRREHNFVQSEKSFKGALFDDGRVGGGKGGRALIPSEEKQGGRALILPEEKQEVVWEVEVEDEVLAKLGGAYVGYLVEDQEAMSIQNHFRMDGYHNLKICSLGYSKILLWSDKAGEVKEVVESVGWWCSMFERLVPWSPLLVSNQRVTWLRCFGVPLHAWGFDLFRALAFKFGRFLEVDEKTKTMARCDAARVRILTGERKLIDATMAVKVLGQRFDIRVVEELGCWEEGGCVGGRKRGGDEDVSSRASSDGGVSAAAMVVGLSKTCSEADVSESCQALLEVDFREGRKKLVESLGRKEDKAKGMSGTSTHILGIPGMLGGKRVNDDGDNWGGYAVVGSGGSEGVLEMTSGRSLSNNESVGLEVVGARSFPGAPLICEIGPAHQFNEVVLSPVGLNGCGKEVSLQKGGGCA
jgi:hypothetical protein